MILGIAQGSPAADANLRSTQRDGEGEVVWGDVVISLNGLRITDSEALLVRLQEFHAGDEVVLGVKRGEEYARVPIRLSSRPNVDSGNDTMPN